ncbi:MAG: polyphosphate kinase 2 family protein [Chloroflexi bacterium]|nr:polyphosphate kinase 2 family protein [Chloroflexota bacterium]
MNTKRFLVRPGDTVSLADHDPAETGGLTKKEAKEALTQLRLELNELQELLYASEEHALLIVLQGMDTSGKDGVIKHVITAFNPQGCQVTGFKVPTSEELAHDFLWRVHRAVPRRGMVGIFNRSHYEDVVVVRVEGLAAEKVWRKRYGMINDFERLLAGNNVVIRKFFLHISKEEQRDRLQDRLKNKRDHWKFRVGDLKARARWDDYMAAYEEALSRCSLEEAPWYIIPADKKWYRNLVISQILAETLRSLDMKWPALEPGAEGIQII